MKVCILYKTYFEEGGGGMSTYLRDLKNHMEELGHEVHIISGRADNPRNNIHNVFSPHIGFLRPITAHYTYAITSFLKLLRLDKEIGFDLIYTIDPSGALSGLTKKVLGKPVVLHLVYTRETRLRDVSKKDVREYLWFIPLLPLTRLSVHGADKIITLCSYFKEEATNYYNVNPDKLVIIPNGVDLPDPPVNKSDGSSGNTFLFIGGQMRKGVKELVKAFESTDIPGKRLVIVGQFNDLPVIEGVTVTGFISAKEMDQIYRESDYFILPSHWEGQPISILEAMSYALPVITTNRFGMVDQVDERVTGLLLDSLEPAYIAWKMEEIAQLNHRKMGLKGRKKVMEQFNWNKIVSKTIKVFEDVTKCI